MREKDDLSVFDFNKARKEFEEKKISANYRILKHFCCLTCKNVRFGYEGLIECQVIPDEYSMFYEVDDLGICDNFVFGGDE